MAEGATRQPEEKVGLSAADMGGGIRTAIGQAGAVFRLFLEVLRGIFKRPFQFREFIEQSWFIASVTILPSALVAIPFGAVVAMQTGSLVQQLGAEAYTGATGAAWTSWIAGAVALVVTAVAIKPSTDVRRTYRVSH